MSGGKKKLKVVIILTCGFLIGVLVLNILIYSKLSSSINKFNKKLETLVPAITKEGIIHTDVDYSKLEKEIDEVHKIYSNISDEKLKLSKLFLSSVRGTWIFVAAVLTLVLGILGFLGCKYAFPKAVEKAVEKGVVDELERSERIKNVYVKLEETYKETNMALARICVRDGFACYKEKKLKRAVELAEKALEFMEKSYPSGAPEGKEEQIFWGTVHGNLAYYYAEQKDVSKYNEALEYAQKSLIVGRRHNILWLIDDYLFTIFSYDVKDETIKENATKIFQSWGEELLKTNEIDRNRYKDYETFFGKIKKGE